MTRYSECSFPRCERASAPQLDQPICPHHAREVYLAVKDMLDTAPTSAKVASADGQGRAFRNHRDTPGLVYFARIGENVKIGFTTNLRQRMKDLGADTLLGTMPGTRADEKRMHVHFGAAWLGGELFTPTPEMLAFAACLDGGP